MMFEKLKILPFYLVYISTFGLASFEKFKTFPNYAPAWFQKQFEETILNVFSSAMTVQYYMIATLEGVITLGFVLSLLRKEFLPRQSKRLLLGSLVLSEFSFAILGFGQRMTRDFHGAAELFSYFGVTAVIILYLETDWERFKGKTVAR